MKPASEKFLFAIENHCIPEPLLKKINQHFERLPSVKRRPYVNLFFYVVLFSISVLRLNAQEIRKTSSSPNHSSEIVLRIKGLSDEKLAATVEDVLRDYPGKILSHAFDKNNNEVSVVISDKLQPVDLLEILEMHGINAGYMNDKKELVVLSEDGDLAEPINITK